MKIAKKFRPIWEEVFAIGEIRLYRVKMPDLIPADQIKCVWGEKKKKRKKNASSKKV